MTIQGIIEKLSKYWEKQGCLVLQPYNSEVGAGTFNPATFFRVLGPEPWRVAYVETSKRPKDGRYGENPNRVQQFYQYQVILKPAPSDAQDLFLRSLEILGIDSGKHDIRFVEDDWESPTLGAWGLGWEVWLDGLEILQFTYFQQIGGIDLEIIPVEYSYGLERIAAHLQKKDSFAEIEWGEGITWGELHLQQEVEFSKFNYEEASIELHLLLFDKFEDEAKRLLDAGYVYPGYDYVIKCSHFFNLLDARGAISAEERKNYIARVRRLAKRAAMGYLKQREKSDYPLLK